MLDCHTVANGASPDRPTSFRLDYDAIRALPVGANYEVERAGHAAALESPEGEPLAHGTPVQFRLPRDRMSERDMLVDNGWAVEELPSGRRVRWWIGFTEKPLEDESLRGVSVLARGKMAQRPFLFQRAQGVSDQLGLEYLVGEVEADWLDEGLDIEEDRIQANRDQLRLEDPDLGEFLKWGRRLVAWALRERGRLRKDKVRKEIDPKVEEMLQPFTKDERRALLHIRVLNETERLHKGWLAVATKRADRMNA